jgi:dTDP-4-amino-4,6-dideoxygalactose transaminase
MNSRLDELQAAILRERLPYLRGWISRRREIAERYSRAFSGASPIRTLPLPSDRARHAHHLYVVQSEDRDGLQRYLKEKGVDALIHYPVPIHLQESCLQIQRDPRGLSQSEAHSKTCLSLPCHPGLTDEQVDRVIAAVNQFGA